MNPSKPVQAIPIGPAWDAVESLRQFYAAIVVSYQQRIQELETENAALRADKGAKLDAEIAAQKKVVDGLRRNTIDVDALEELPVLENA